ncbi:2-oxoglutarate-dependent dioxygenase 19-like [Humulus lupulus]|uniref:2-oxoglutarate-dependent dioxygenase 19-like n=1 Tax=Humulus lupulus TaxID=3486 RepID=UPI002B40C6BE|nr:2-oxoglutarate-dependent dioxygenase 19-like [Humulus lupulus]
MRAISETLGLEPNCLKKATNLDEGFQFLTSNQYPPCPDPEKVIELPPHTDLALMNILMQNHVGGLQILHKGKWVNWKAMPNTMIVGIGDQIQILSNGLYKSVNHRAVVNNKSTRISIVAVHGPGMNTKIDPIPELLEAHGQTPTYSGNGSVGTQGQRCKLLDWNGYGNIVAYGYFISNNPKYLVLDALIRPFSMKVGVDFAREPDAFLWSTKESVGIVIAWLADKVTMR